MTIFTEIKSSIDLIDYLANEGFTISHKSTKKDIVLENNATGEKLLVFDKDAKGNSYGHWIYKNLIIEDDKGDVLTYVRNRINGLVLVDYSKQATAEAIKILKPKLNKPVKENNPIKKTVKKLKLKKELTLSNYNTKPIEDFNFLYQRGIHPKTINHKDFKNKIFNAYYFNKNYHIKSNTAFAKTIDWNSKPVGYEVRNHDIRKVKNDPDIKQVYIPFKSVAFNDAALFFSNIPKENKPITHLFFAESAIDILAYHEILSANKKGYDFNKNNHLFISFSGNIYDQKLENLENALAKLNINKDTTRFIYITDNDKKGYYYDLSLVTTLINHYKTPIELKITDSNFYRLEFDNSLVDISNFEKLIKAHNQNIEKNMSPQDATNLYGKFIIFKKLKQKHELLIPIQENSIQTSIKLITTLFGISNFYIPHKPTIKGIDWNDQLLIKKNIKTPELILKEAIHIKNIQKQIRERKTAKLNNPNPVKKK